MTRRLRVDRMRRYPIVAGPNRRPITSEQCRDQEYLERLARRVVAAYPGHAVDLTIEQNGEDFTRNVHYLRWFVRPKPPVIVVNR